MIFPLQHAALCQPIENLKCHINKFGVEPAQWWHTGGLRPELSRKCSIGLVQFFFKKSEFEYFSMRCMFFYCLQQTLPPQVTHSYRAPLASLFPDLDALTVPSSVRPLLPLMVFKQGRGVIQHCFQVNLVLCAGQTGSIKETDFNQAF